MSTTNLQEISMKVVLAVWLADRICLNYESCDILYRRAWEHRLSHPVSHSRLWFLPGGLVCLLFEPPPEEEPNEREAQAGLPMPLGRFGQA